MVDKLNKTTDFNRSKEFEPNKFNNRFFEHNNNTFFVEKYKGDRFSFSFHLNIQNDKEKFGLSRMFVVNRKLKYDSEYIDFSHNNHSLKG